MESIPSAGNYLELINLDDRDFKALHINALIEQRRKRIQDAMTMRAAFSENSDFSEWRHSIESEIDMLIRGADVVYRENWKSLPKIGKVGK